MENVLLLIALFFSKLTAPPVADGAEWLSAPDPTEVVWSTLYPNLSASLRTTSSPREMTLLPDEPDTHLGARALYATNRTVWHNFLAQAAAAAEAASPENAEGAALAELEEVRARLSGRLARGAAAVLGADLPPDRLDPASRELATAYMDLADLNIPVRQPEASSIGSPLLGSFLSLYAEDADQSSWRAFASEVQICRFSDAVHLVPRVPSQFLGQAYVLIDQIGPPEEIKDAADRVVARELIELRVRLVGQ